MKSHRAHSLLPILPDEVIVEILSWLPVKPLLRFRCACKSWRSLISDPSFVKLHLQRSARKENLILCWEHVSDCLDESETSAVSCSVHCLLESPSSAIPEVDCYRLKDEDCYWVVGSCNGLISLVSFIIGNEFEEYWLRLWNPATRLRSEKLACLHVDGRHQFGLAKFAFGYDNVTDTYKVVAFCWDSEAREESHETHVKVYSLGDNCWRNIQSYPFVPIGIPHPGHNDGVYLNGTLNWLGLCNFSEDYKWNKTITIDQLVIVSLDLGKETFRQLLLPRGLDELPDVEPTLGVLMGCLWFSHDCKRTHFVVWQMREFGVDNSWNKVVNISYHAIQIDCLEYSYPMLPVCMSENGDVLIMAKDEELQVILFNWRNNRVERTEIPNNISWTDARDYVESLVSPCCN